QRIIYILLLLFITVPSSIAQHREAIPYAHFEQWVTRHITESPILGGNARSLYAIAPDTVINGAVAYRNLGGSPWATSNAYANIIGIKKVSCTAVPENREGGGKCARLDSKLEVVRVLGMVDIEVLISGSIYLGELYEPIRSVNNPYGKMTMGIPFTKRPKKLIFDYNLTMSKNGNRIYSTGLSPKKVVQGPDSAEVYILLQHRWEDEDGNVYAHRVGTGRERFTQSTDGWVNEYAIDVHYGDISQESYFRPYMDLLNGKRSYSCMNSKGKIVPVQEVSWGAPDEEVTHMLVMASSGCGTAFVGAEGTTLLVDNFYLEY
ncbi:MAG: PCMD domain-containing protein, partial [Bacteroidaceae bacterium]|nr:PCMD domain-containing protein [Bacteroidaceae bacterium]